MKTKKTVKFRAWANINGLNGKFYAASPSYSALLAHSDEGDEIVPCTITYTITKPAKAKKV